MKKYFQQHNNIEQVHAVSNHTANHKSRSATACAKVQLEFQVQIQVGLFF